MVINHTHRTCAASFVFAGKKIPELMRGLGRGIREFKDAKDNVQRAIEDHVNEDRKTTSTTKQVINLSVYL